MRIISGTMRGKKLVEFEAENIRPITDMAKTALFNILYDRITGCDFLDLYAGTGSVGIEALSRGAGSACFIDLSRDACRIIKKNLEITKFTDAARVINADCKKALSRMSEKFHYIFLDPPFHEKLDTSVFEVILERELLHDGGEIILKHHEKEKPPENFDGLSLYDTRRYGNSKLSFYLKGKKG